ncbi:MAG: MFS transporter [Burkholderiaceae bacterium]|nr:MFS transporter [Burkholderiaceae bacterium]
MSAPTSPAAVGTGIAADPAAGRWRALLVLSVARVAMGFQFQAIAATAPTLQQQFGFDLAFIGWLIGLYLLPGILFALPSGMLGARFGDRRMAALGLGLMSLGGTVLAIATDESTLVLGRLLCGVGGVLFNVLVQKMVADWFVGREIVMAMAIIVNTWPIGMALALMTLGGVAASHGIGSAFGLTAAFSLVSLLLLVSFYRAPAAATVASSPNLGAISRREWQLLAFAGLAWMSFNVVFAGFASFVPAYLIEDGFGATAANRLTGLNTLVVSIAIPIGGYLIQRFRCPGLVTQLGVLGAAVAMGLMLVALPRWPWVLMAGFFAGLAAGPIVAMPAQFLRAETRATGMGVSLTIFYVGMAFLPGPIGALADRFGSTRAIVVALIGISVLTALSAWVTTWLQRRSAT